MKIHSTASQGLSQRKEQHEPADNAKHPDGDMMFGDQSGRVLENAATRLRFSIRVKSMLGYSSI